MESKIKIERCELQLLHGKRFLLEHQQNLVALYKNASFRSMLNDLEAAHPAETIYSPSFHGNRKFKHGELQTFFIQNRIYERFPDYREIIDRMSARQENTLSGLISVFYAIKYLENIEGQKKESKPILEKRCPGCGAMLTIQTNGEAICDYCCNKKNTHVDSKNGSKLSALGKWARRISWSMLAFCAFGLLVIIFTIMAYLYS